MDIIIVVSKTCSYHLICHLCSTAANTMRNIMTDVP